MIYAIRKTLPSIVLFIVCLLVVYNTTFNGHYHFLHSGNVIYHAHPIEGSTSKQGFPEHGHDQFQLLAYDLILIAFICLPLISLFVFIFQTFFPQSHTPHLCNAIKYSFCLRAPPIFS
jgi:hypothetical protein